MRKNNLFPKPKWRFQKSAVFPDPEEIFKRFVKLVINCWFSREKKMKKKSREKFLDIKVGKLHNANKQEPLNKNERHSKD